MKRIALYLMVLLYVAAGVIHFTTPGFYLNIMPDWLPTHQLLLNLSGIAEIILGLLLLPRQTRPLAAWLIIIMLVVFLLLIHIPMTLDYWQNNTPGLWLTIARIPLQFLLIWWAWQYTRHRATGHPALK
ncbi:DoxX family protein [Pontibacter sp. 172403-2]|uniref:DoxX family protein n=1 Tax=Pontibacter rufus TaxID=2791028 RepID=UPI0018AFE263|nr:DoxX family protein [Pontibacter sp. 172403-2]MBF9252776.1 DoxX family protein [Pontibacter sp. 172403-2]